jgi:hypothetical protein
MTNDEARMTNVGAHRVHFIRHSDFVIRHFSLAVEPSRERKKKRASNESKTL